LREARATEVRSRLLQGSDGKTTMSVHKRNELTVMAATSIPGYFRANEPDEALKRIREALFHLDRLKSPVVQAYRERATDEGGHLAGDED
jgi:hypothetical protein